MVPVVRSDEPYIVESLPDKDVIAEAKDSQFRSCLDELGRQPGLSFVFNASRRPLSHALHQGG